MWCNNWHSGMCRETSHQSLDTEMAIHLLKTIRQVLGTFLQEKTDVPQWRNKTHNTCTKKLTDAPVDASERRVVHLPGRIDRGAGLSCTLRRLVSLATPSSIKTGYNVIMTLTLYGLSLGAAVRKSDCVRQISGTPTACSIADATSRHDEICRIQLSFPRFTCWLSQFWRRRFLRLRTSKAPEQGHRSTLPFSPRFQEEGNK